jgi:tetratricopeptide (TPR) repeat protein
MWLLALPLLLGLALAQSEALPALVHLSGVRHEYQRFNNCGPVTLGMAMSYWGGQETQYQIAPVLKPNPQDKNVSPAEMVAYARGKGYKVHYGIAGNYDLLKRLLAAQFPTIVESWFVTKHGGMGHYRLLVGYDDQAGYFNAFDSYWGPKVTLKYKDLDALWQVFNRTYIVVYPASRQPQLKAILGERLDETKLLQKAFALATSETQSQPNNAFAWFNLGDVLLQQGDAKGAAAAYDRSRAQKPNLAFDTTRPRDAVNGWPFRMMWYQFGPYQAYYKAGRYGDVVRLANDVLRRINDHEESFYWRGLARKAQGDLAGAKADFQIALRYRPSYREAAQALKNLNVRASR